MQNGGEGIRTTLVVQQGGQIPVEVGPNDTTVEIKIVGTNSSKSFDVEPNKTSSVPVPPVPGGTLLFVTVGKGLRARVTVVEVVSSFR